MHRFHERTLRRLGRRVALLKRHFVWSLRHFDAKELFSGPSLYFHRRTIECRRKHHSAVDALHDSEFYDLLYATLTAWGLHRMGPGNAKLLDLPAIRESLVRNSDRIHALEGLRLSDFGSMDGDLVTKRVWAVLRDLKVTKAKAFLVANTKALHHVLPALVPPVDRQYTLDFFFGAAIIDGREEAAFRVMYPLFHDIAKSKASVIQRWIHRNGWHTSESKVVDNAIVGYWL